MYIYIIMNLRENSISDIIRKDPLLYKIFKPQKLNTDIFDKTKTVQWIGVPTSVKEGSKDSVISFLSVNTYSGEECSEILKSLLVSDGKDIVFSDEGHIACNFGKNYTASKFFPNPFASKNTTKDSRPISFSNTIYSRVLNKYKQVYYYSKDVMFSPNMHWILYAIPNLIYIKKDGKWIIETIDNKNTNLPDDFYVPVYVLLYNTVQRKNFQSIYSKILNLNSDTFSTQNLLGANTDYFSTISRYANAFRIKRYTSRYTGKNFYHYGDPTCTLSLSVDLASLNFFLNSNLTINSLQQDFYYNGMKGYLSSLKLINRGYLKSAPYCILGGSNGPSQYARDFNMLIVTDSISFLRQLANNVIYQTLSSGVITPDDWNPEKPGFSNAAITCPAPSVNITTCQLIIDAAGNIILKGDNVSQVCGSKSDKPDKPKPDKPKPDKPKPDDPKPDDPKPDDPKPDKPKPDDPKPDDPKPDDPKPDNPFSNLPIEQVLFVIFLIITFIILVLYL